MNFALFTSELTHTQRHRECSTMNVNGKINAFNGKDQTTKMGRKTENKPTCKRRVKMKDKNKTKEGETWTANNSTHCTCAIVPYNVDHRVKLLIKSTQVQIWTHNYYAYRCDRHIYTYRERERALGSDTLKHDNNEMNKKCCALLNCWDRARAMSVKKKWKKYKHIMMITVLHLYTAKQDGRSHVMCR